MTIKILTVIGARPQFIKAATVSRQIALRDDLQEVIVHTGQHYDSNMSDVFFEELDIPKPHYHLGIGGGTHGAMTGRQLEAIEQVLLKEMPDWVLVYGDTNSTLAGALAAVKLHIPVAHVEAGLRSFNRKMPEEINRILTDHASTLLFTPTNTATRNLASEGIAGEKVQQVGDVMYDAALFYKERARKPDWFDALKIEPGTFVLCTIHRAENTDDLERMKCILVGLQDSGLPVILPLHPRTKKVLIDAGLNTPQNVYVVDPVGYLEMVWLEVNCKIIATDSGGVQKEAYFHGKPCVTLRDETEWVELVDAGWNVLVGANRTLITSGLMSVFSFPEVSVLYGCGQSAASVVSLLNLKNPHGRQEN